MKTILYVSLTADERLGQSDRSAHAIPPEILADFVALARRSSALSSAAR